MKTITEYLINNHIKLDKRYNNTNWEEWKFNGNITNKEHEAFVLFVKQKYGGTSINDYCRLLQDYMIDFCKISPNHSECTPEELKREIQYIKKIPTNILTYLILHYKMSL